MKAAAQSFVRSNPSIHLNHNFGSLTVATLNCLASQSLQRRHPLCEVCHVYATNHAPIRNYVCSIGCIWIDMRKKTHQAITSMYRVGRARCMDAYGKIHHQLTATTDRL